MKKLNFEQMEQVNGGSWENFGCNMRAGMIGGLYGALMGGVIGGFGGFLVGVVLSSEFC